MTDEEPPRMKRAQPCVDIDGSQCDEKTLTFDGKWCCLCCPECEMSAESTTTYAQYLAAQHKHIRMKHIHGNKRTHEGNGKPQGAFAFTLTKSPTDDLTEEDMVMAVRKLLAYESYKMHKFAWYLEYKDGKDHPHIHGMYELEGKGRIENKFFKRAWPIWDPKLKMGKGFRGGYHRPVRSEEGYKDYISEDGGLHDSMNVYPE